MSKRNRREHGRILSVETMQRGSALDADAAAGATSITVTDAGDFDEDGGWLYIGAQVVEFAACDDDTGVITFKTGTTLTAAAEQGDPVHIYDPLYAEVVDYQVALVQLDGEGDNPDPVEAEVAEGVTDLPEGDRGRAGESCTLLRVADDEWEVVGVGGRPRSSSGTGAVRWEANDVYVLTAADITAGVATCPLSHQPDDESMDARWRTTPQEPTEYTVNADQTVTWPLSGFEAAGDRLWFHYTYRKGITTATVPPELQPLTVRASTATQEVSSETGTTWTDTLALPAGTVVGDSLILVTSHSRSGLTVSITDARFVLVHAGTYGQTWKAENIASLGSVTVSYTGPGGFTETRSLLAAVNLPFDDRLVVSDFGAGAVSVPALSSGGSGALATLSVLNSGSGDVWSGLTNYTVIRASSAYSTAVIAYRNAEPIPAGAASWNSGSKTTQSGGSAVVLGLAGA